MDKIELAMAALEELLVPDKRSSSRTPSREFLVTHGKLILACLAVARDVAPVNTETGMDWECPCCASEWYGQCSDEERHASDCPYAALQALLEASDG